MYAGALWKSCLEEMSGHMTSHHIIALFMMNSQTSDIVHIRLHYHIIKLIFIFRLFVVITGGVEILLCSSPPFLF